MTSSTAPGSLPPNAPGTGTGNRRSRGSVRVGNRATRVNAQRSGATAIRRATRWSLRAIALALLLILLLIAILSALFRLGSPHIGVYKTEIQAWLSDYLKTPVEIGEMEFSWGGANPRITLDNVALKGNASAGISDADPGADAGATPTAYKEGAAVEFRQVWLDLNLPATVFGRGWDINEVTIVGADLDLEYYGEQDFRVRGYDQVKTPDASKAADTSRKSEDRGSQALSWLLAARNASLIDSSITIHDISNKQEYRLDSINISAQNRGNKHRVTAEVLLPDGFGRSLQLEADLVSSNGDLERASGNAKIKGEQLVFERWMELVPKRSLELAGTADIEIHGEWNATKLNNVTANIKSPEITFGSYPQNQSAMEMQNFSSDIEWLRTPKGWVANVSSMDFLHRDKSASFERTSLEIVDDEVSGRLWHIESGGPALDLKLLGSLTETFRTLLPMGDWPSVVANTRPSGELLDWRLSVDRGVSTNLTDGLPAMSITGMLENLETTASGSIPGIKGIDMHLSIADNAGKVVLVGNNVFFEQAQSFTTPLLLDQIEGVLDVDFTNEQLEVTSDTVVVNDRSLKGDADFIFRHSEASPAWLHLNGRYDLQQVTDLPRYIPRAMISPWVAEWIEESLLAGTATDGTVLFKGEFDGFPFHRAEGEFEAGMQVTGARLDYQDEWPVLENASGRLTFSKKSMGFDLDTGRVSGIDLLPGKLHIESLFRPVVNLQLQADDSVEKYLGFVRTSPIEQTLGAALADVQSTGDAKLAVTVNVPLRARKNRLKDEVFNVRGTLGFENNRLSSESYRTTLESVTGNLAFTDTGLDSSSVNARYLGHPVVVETHSSGRGRKRLSEMVLAGTIDNKSLARHHEIPVDEFLTGSSPWYVNIEIPHDTETLNRSGVLLTATTNLQGTAVELPAPLGKSAGSKKRLSVSSSFASSGKTPVWRVHLGRHASALAASDDTGEGLRSLMMKLGGNPVTGDMPDGIHLRGRVDELSMDDWIEAIATLLDATDDGSGVAEDWPMITTDLRSPNLLIGNKGQGAARIKVTSNGAFLNGVIENALLRGSVRMPRTAVTQGNPVQVRIADADKRLLDGYLEDDDAGSAAAEPPVDPFVFPPLNIYLARLQWDELLLEDLVARTEPDAAGMKITTIGFVHDNAQLSGDGFWHWRDPQNINAAFEGQQISQLDLQLRTNDIGRAMNKWGFDPTIAEGRGTVDASIYWQGPIYKPDLSEISGNVELALRRGRLLDVEPGAARLFGLFALDRIPRRLELDFSDITDEGLDFDTVDGRLKIAGGNAISELVQLQGPVGVVDVTGAANFVERTYDQRITVLPRISAALPIIGVISGGATAGIGVLIAGPLLKALGLDIDKIGLTEYSVTGSWDKPLVAPLRSSGSR